MLAKGNVLTDYEITSRVKNIGWTVSGDYDLAIDVDTDFYCHSEYAAMYEAIKQGALNKYFDTERLNDYILKKLYLGASLADLMMLYGICTDVAAFSFVKEERLGLSQIRKRAYGEYLAQFEAEIGDTYAGALTCRVMHYYLNGLDNKERVLTPFVLEVLDLENVEDTDGIIEAIDNIYNELVDRDFSEKSGTLRDVLNVTEEELSEWKPGQDVSEMLGNSACARSGSMLRNGLPGAGIGNNENRNSDRNGIFSDFGDSDEKMLHYIRQIFGKSLLTEQENRILNRRLCTGVHRDCYIYFTDGLLCSIPENSAYYKYDEMFKLRNLDVFKQNKTQIRRNIADLTELLKKSLKRRSEPDWSRRTSGKVVVRDLWKVGRTDERRLFEHEEKRDNSSFVIDLLIDGSGSQSPRQSMVAIQAYIISEALSSVGIPFRVISFCSFWEYTVLRRFRDYDSPREENLNIFEYRGRANNRDGLAINAVCDGLLKRGEEHKLLFILSDGRPNAVSRNTETGKNTEPYQGERAVKDTGFAVRKAREMGISVLGIYTGTEEDLEAEHKIFGNSFAYTKNIEYFSKLVGKFLRMQLETD